MNRVLLIVPLLLLPLGNAFAQSFAYVTNASSGSVSVINTATNTVTATVAVGSSPRGVTVSPDGSRVYVANTNTGNVSVIDTGTNTVVATLPVGGLPVGIVVAPNGSRVFVANNASSNVSVIDTVTNTVTATIAVGPFPRRLAVSPDGSRVYVTRGAELVSVINTTNNTVIATMTVSGRPEGLAVSPDGSRLYVARFNSDTLSVVDTATNTVTATVTVGDGPYGVTVTADGSRVYVANQNTNRVSVIDTATNAVSNVTVGSGASGLALTPDGSRAYVSNLNSGNVSVIDTVTSALIGSAITVGSQPWSIAIGPAIVPAVSAPSAPVAPTATAGDEQATVTFTAPAFNGGAAITNYTVTSNPTGFTGTGAGSPIVVTGLSNGVAYTFTVTATNSAGTGAASAASNSVTPRRVESPVTARDDRVFLREGSGTVDIAVLGNDRFDAADLIGGALVITSGPTLSLATVQPQGNVDASRLVIRYTLPAGRSGTDRLRYRLCTASGTFCDEAEVFIEIRALAQGGVDRSVDSDGSFVEVSIENLRALPSARFEAFGLVAPASTNVALASDPTPGNPFDGFGSSTIIRKLAAGAAPRDWRVFVDARSLSGGDIDVYLGIDANNNGVAEPSEQACGSAMSDLSERCELALTAPVDDEIRYWIVLNSASGEQIARVQAFEVPLDVAQIDRTLAATGPGSVEANGDFKVRLGWFDPTFVVGESRGGWVHVMADDASSLGWLPVRFDRDSGEPQAFAMSSGVDHVLALPAGAAHERLYIDVPPGATQLAVTTRSAGFIDVYLARTAALTPSASMPLVAAAPPRSQAVASGSAPDGNESVVVANPAAGRWYVTPTNSPLANTATVTVRATVTATAAPVRSGGYFNPERSGSGLFVYSAGDQWAGLWYTYLQDGTPTWYFLQAAAPGPNGIWRGTVFRSSWNGSSNRLTVVGQATVTPAASGLTFSYTLDGQSGSEAFTNFSGSCPTVGGLPLDISGHWFDPTRSGTGYTVQTFLDYEFYLAFVYDGRGVARNLVAERAGLGGPTAAIPLQQLQSACPLCAFGGLPARTTVGTFQRRIGAGTLQQVDVSATFVNGVPGAWTQIDRPVPLGELGGCAVQ